MNRKLTFCTYDAPLFHGPNTWLKRLLPELRKNNFDVEILVFFEEDLSQCETYNYLFNLGFPVHVFPFKSLAEEKIMWILRTLSSDPPDIFFPNMLVHAYYAGKWLKKAGIITVGLIHSDDKFYEGIMDEFIADNSCYNVTAVVACSQYLYSKVNSKKEDNVISKCIPYGVPLKNIAYASFDLPILKLIYTGRLIEEQKRISEVVKAMCKACNEIDGVEGIIYGHGDVKKVVNIITEHSINKKVKFGGTVSNSQIFNVLSQANVFVLLSDYEGLSQSLLEAMACGLVPVCTDMKSGIPELITNNETGIIVKDRKAGFVDAIKQLKNDLALCKKISTNAKQKIESYSEEVCTNSWIDFLNGLLTTNSKRTKIDIPEKIDLPSPHPQLKKEDFRRLSAVDKVVARLRKIKNVILIKQH